MDSLKELRRVLDKKKRTMDNVQNYDIYINIPSFLGCCIRKFSSSRDMTRYEYNGFPKNLFSNN
jgi:hypothetical protein